MELKEHVTKNGENLTEDLCFNKLKWKYMVKNNKIDITISWLYGITLISRTRMSMYVIIDNKIETLFSCSLHVISLTSSKSHAKFAGLWIK